MYGITQIFGWVFISFTVTQILDEINFFWNYIPLVYENTLLLSVFSCCHTRSWATNLGATQGTKCWPKGPKDQIEGIKGKLGPGVKKWSQEWIQNMSQGPTRQSGINKTLLSNHFLYWIRGLYGREVMGQMIWPPTPVVGCEWMARCRSAPISSDEQEFCDVSGHLADAE